MNCWSRVRSSTRCQWSITSLDQISEVYNYQTTASITRSLWSVSDSYETGFVLCTALVTTPLVYVYTVICHTKGLTLIIRVSGSEASVLIYGVYFRTDRKRSDEKKVSIYDCWKISLIFFCFKVSRWRRWWHQRSRSIRKISNSESFCDKLGRRFHQERAETILNRER